MQVDDINLPYIIIFNFMGNFTMSLVEEVIELTRKDESPILEFKRQWYWDNSTPVNEMAAKWGEFQKDLISLSNAYLEQQGKKRYLIIGYSDEDGDFFDINRTNIKQLSDKREFKKSIIQKLELITKPALNNFSIEFLEIKGKEILVFIIEPPSYLFELKKELKTKTRHHDEGAILVRKGQSNEQVRTSTQEETKKLNYELKTYREQKSLFENEKTKTKVRDTSKDRSIEKTVQLFIDKNKNYSLDIDYPIKHKDWDENIIFEFYRLSDILSDKIYFLYLHESSTQAKTFGYLKHKNILDEKTNNRLIILTERPNIKDNEKRKENIKSQFLSDKVYFIDEFGYEYLYKDCIADYIKYNLPIYVDSMVENSEDNKSAHSYLHEWYIKDAEPIFVIKGHGGIGKTTLAKQFLDHIYGLNPKSGILFIDSNEIINELAKISDSTGKIDDIFDFYSAQVGFYDSNEQIFSKELLRLSIDNGSLIIVLDGLDEVIARLGVRFDTTAFLSSIFSNYSNTLQKAKILITCRDHFWDNSGMDMQIPEVTLKPFNISLATNFFNQAFSNDEIKTNRALAIADKIAIQSNDDDEYSDAVYIPYVLDIIKYLVKSKDENIGLKENLKSEIINSNFQDDFVVASVCSREVKKLETLDLDAQLKLLINIAISDNSSISLYDVKLILNQQGINADDILVDKIKGHPLLTCSGNSLSFRYDFFNSYFKSLYISNFLNSSEIKNLDDKTINLISGYVRYNNSFSRAVCERINSSEALTLFIIECIESIESNEKIINKPHFMSSIFMLPLTLLIVSNSLNSNLESRTKIMLDLFEEKGSIKEMSLINIFGYEASKPTFDFRNKTLENCTFDNYEYFWDCQLNENTRFKSGYFNALTPRSGLKPTFYEDTFGPDCDINGIKEIITTRNDDVSDQLKLIRDDLIRLFKIFHERGNFYPKKQEQVRSKVFTSRFLPTLIKNKIILEYIDKKKPNFEQYIVSPKYSPILNLLEQGGACLEFDDVVSLFIK